MKYFRHEIFAIYGIYFLSIVLGLKIVKTQLLCLSYVLNNWHPGFHPVGEGGQGKLPLQTP